MSGLPWLRLYSNMIDNGKIRLLAYEDRWHFVAILCIKQQGILKIKPGLLERNIAVKLGLQLRELDEVKRRLMEVELIDENWHPIGWDDHQFQSDSGAARMQKYREKQKANVTVTSPLRHSDVPDKIRRDKKRTEKAQPRARFAAPEPGDVDEYAQQNGFSLDGFFDYYTANNWVTGRGNKMKDWRAAARGWNRRQKDFKSQSAKSSVAGYNDPNALNRGAV